MAVNSGPPGLPHARTVQESYDKLAEEYAARIADELQHKPLDRELLDRFADRVRGAGLVCDLGCGPAHVGRYLDQRGVQVVGIDLSPGMLATARRLNPGMALLCGDMLALAVRDHAFAGLAAFYSIIHVPRAEVPRALREMRRVLRPAGQLLLAFHRGGEVLHTEELWGQRINLDAVHFETEEMCGYLSSAGFTVEEALQRDPYPQAVEYQSRRAYLWASKPG
jgi:SAM-dependent methyltransferase